MAQNINMAELGQRTQQATHQAMELTRAGAVEGLRYGRRFIRSIWDPQPTNDRVLNRPVWCLGCSYTCTHISDLPAADPQTQPDSLGPTAPAPTSPASMSPPVSNPQTIPSNTAHAPSTPPESSSSSFSSSLAYDEPPEDGGWPPAFLDDFESRIWMTYRSAFPPIARSADPDALASMSFAMRLKALADPQAGFSSDSGWGCMIRSGQSLLANALLMRDLGRGEFLLGLASELGLSNNC